MDYYKMSEKELRISLNGKLEPLSSQEVEQRIAKDGLNQIEQEKKKNPFLIFLKQFTDFLVIILIIASIISLIFNEISSAIVILVVITINAILGTVQEIKAQKSIDGLKKLSSPGAKVLRDGKFIMVDSKDICCGDEILLEAGDYIPADARIIESNSLQVEEAPLTGESVAVLKESEVISNDVPLAERKNMVYGGCYVTYGRARAIVCAISMDTELGKIAKLLKNTKEKKTPLQVNLDKFGKKLSISIIILCALIFIVQIINKAKVIDAFMFAVALAVAAIPEALSSIVSIVLAFGMQKMAKEGAIMRKLQSVEGLGSVSIICSDKTGTLTQNKMTVEHYYCNNKDYDFVNSNVELDDVKKLMIDSILCSDATRIDGKPLGDPTEVALIDIAHKYEINEIDIRKKYTRVSELPFDSDRKLMSTLIKNGTYHLVTKGAMDVILSRCNKIYLNGEVKDITKEEIELLKQQNLLYSENGLRVLAFAYKEYDENRQLSLDDENNLIFLGLIAMMDPPREESFEAVKQCKEAGIIPIMITGDHIITASAIARRIGILGDNDRAVEGKDIENLTDEELKDFVKDVRVYARVSPEHKIRIVRAWQNLGNIVSMTGDGVNDAPALKQADVGVAMGITGTEVSKQAASMILTDDNFATIVKAINNGRNVYANIKKSIQFLISGNFAAILVVLVCSLAFLPVPFAPVHLLFINLLTDSLPAIALGIEPHNDDVMKEKPRPMNESIMNKKFLLNVGIEGLIIAIFTFAGFMIGVMQNDALLASTNAFAVLCLSRLLHGYSSKKEESILFKKGLFNNKFMQYAFMIGFILITIIMVVPGLNVIFETKQLNFIQLLIIYGLAFGSFLTIQLFKFIKSKILKK